MKEPHPVPSYLWEVVGTDIFHWNNHDYLLVVDYYSRYCEVVKLKSMKAECIITEMKKILSRFRIPEEIKSNNGPQYASKKF